MRRVKRLTLNETAKKYLNKRQEKANQKKIAGTLDIEKEWKGARQTKTMESVLKTLQKMMGSRERCMYCLDSHGSDIEHFRPKATYSNCMFRWPNFLLCCTECGRFKGSQFPLIGNRRLLIDPTREEPWRYLDFDPVTGNITARFDASLNDWSAKGSKTVEILQLDRREALAAGYLKTFQRLAKIVRDFLNDPVIPAQKLADSLWDADDHGLLGWVFVGTGQNESPFDQLHAGHPAIWQVCNQTFKRN